MPSTCLGTMFHPIAIPAENLQLLCSFVSHSEVIVEHLPIAAMCIPAPSPASMDVVESEGIPVRISADYTPPSAKGMCSHATFYLQALSAVDPPCSFEFLSEFGICPSSFQQSCPQQSRGCPPASLSHPAASHFIDAEKGQEQLRDNPGSRDRFLARESVAKAM